MHTTVHKIEYIRNTIIHCSFSMSFFSTISMERKIVPHFSSSHSNKFHSSSYKQFLVAFTFHMIVYIEWRHTDGNGHVIITFIRKQITWSFSRRSLVLAVVSLRSFEGAITCDVKCVSFTKFAHMKLRITNGKREYTAINPNRREKNCGVEMSSFTILAPKFIS